MPALCAGARAVAGCAPDKHRFEAIFRRPAAAGLKTVDEQQYRCWRCWRWARNTYPAGALVLYAKDGPMARKLEDLYQRLAHRSGARGLVVHV